MDIMIRRRERAQSAVVGCSAADANRVGDEDGRSRHPADTTEHEETAPDTRLKGLVSRLTRPACCTQRMASKPSPQASRTKHWVSWKCHGLQRYSLGYVADRIGMDANSLVIVADAAATREISLDS